MTSPHLSTSSSASSASSSSSLSSDYPNVSSPLPSFPSSHSIPYVSTNPACASSAAGVCGVASSNTAAAANTSAATTSSAVASAADDGSCFSSNARGGKLLPRPGDDTAASAMGSISSPTDSPVAVTDASSPPEETRAALTAATAAHPPDSATTPESARQCTTELEGVHEMASALGGATADDVAATAEEGVHQAELASEMFAETCKLHSVISRRSVLLRATAAAAAVELLLLTGNVLVHFVKVVGSAGLQPPWFAGAALGTYFLPLLRAVVVLYCMLSFYRFSLFPFRCRGLGALGSCNHAFTIIRRNASAASVLPSSPQNDAPGAAYGAPRLHAATADAPPLWASGSTASGGASASPTTGFAPDMKAALSADASSAGARPGDVPLAAAEGTVQWRDGRSDVVANSETSILTFGGHSCRSCNSRTDRTTLETEHNQEPLLGCRDIETAAPAGAAEVDRTENVPQATYLPAGGSSDYAAVGSHVAGLPGRAVVGMSADMLMLAEAETVVAAAEQMEAEAAARAHISKERSSRAYRLLLLCFLGGTLRAINFQLPAVPSFREEGSTVLQLPFFVGFWPSWLWRKHNLHLEQQQYWQQRTPLLPPEPTETTTSSSDSKKKPHGSLRFDASYLRLPVDAVASPVPGAATGTLSVETVTPPGSPVAGLASHVGGGGAAEASAGKRDTSGAGYMAQFDDGEGSRSTSAAFRFPDATAGDAAAASNGSAARASFAAATEDLPAASSGGVINAWRLLLLFLLLETAWGVAAPFVDAVLLWKLQRCAADEHSVLRRCLSHATARYESLLQQQQRREEEEQQEKREEEQQQGGEVYSQGVGQRKTKQSVSVTPPGGAAGGAGTAAAAETGVTAASLLLQRETEMAAAARGEKQRCPVAAATEGRATPLATPRQAASGQGAAGRAAAGAAAPSPAADAVLEEDNVEDDVDWLDLLKLLRPYFWPSGEEGVEGSSIAAPAAGDEEKRRIWRSPLVLRMLAVSTFFTIACSKALTLLSPLLIGAAAQAAAEAAAAAAAQQHEQALAKGRAAALWVVAFSAASWGADFFKEAQSLAYVKVQQAASVEISARTLRHVLALHLEWHIKKQMGHVVRVIDRGTEGCSSLMTYGILYLGPVLLECVAVCLVFLFHLKHQVLASLLFLSVALYAWLTLRVTFWRRKWREKQNRSDSTFHQLVVDALTNFETVKMFNAERFEVGRYVDAVEEYQAVGTKIQASLSFLNLSQRTVVCATLVGGLVFVAQAIGEGSMGLADFVTAHMYFMNVFAPLNFLGTIYHVIVRSAIDARALCRLLLTEPGIVDAPNATSLVEVLSISLSPAAVAAQQQQQQVLRPVAAGDRDSSNRRETAETSPSAKGFQAAASQRLLAEEEEVEEATPFNTQLLQRREAAAAAEAARTAMHAPRIDFVNICFSYGGRKSSKGSLRNLNLTIMPGTTCGLVGASGSGKSTLMKLLLRLLEPRRGRVLIDGVDIATVTQESLRCCMGMVPQDAVMFNASIYSNIVYANRQASFEEVEAAAEAAQLLPLIHSMKEGWETRIGERGLKLSGGERQRVAIARCLLRNPPIVLLDEATSSLDSLSEAAIQEALLQLSNRRTVLMIAHRLSTVMHADLICVMADGMIVEQGTHAELLATGGAYANLWKAQARGKTLQL